MLERFHLRRVNKQVWRVLSQQYYTRIELPCNTHMSTWIPVAVSGRLFSRLSPFKYKTRKLTTVISIPRTESCISRSFGRSNYINDPISCVCFI